jgi:signal transduction histidine kinase
VVDFSVRNIYSGRHARSFTWLTILLIALSLATAIQLFDDLDTHSAAPAVFVPVGPEAQQLNVQMYFLYDTVGNYSVDEVGQGKAGVFKPMLTGNLGYGYPHKALWIKFIVDAKDYPDPYWFLMERWEHVGTLNLFYPVATGDRTFQTLSLTEEKSAKSRPFDVHQYLFKVPTASGATTYYMRYAPNGHTVNVSLTWAGMKGMVEFIHDAQLWLGLFFGGLIIMWFYNLILLLYLRDRAYFYYIYYLGGFIVTFAYMNGFAPLFMKMGWWPERLFALAGYAAMHGVILFARHFLLLKDTTPRLDKTLKVCQWLVVVGMVAIFVLQQLNPYFILNYLIFPLVPLLIAAGVVRWRQGYAPARVYCLGWIAFAISLALIGLKFIGLLPANFVTNYSIQFSSAWEAMIFAFALAYRIKLTEAESKEQSARFVKELEAAYEKEKEAVKEKTVFIAAVSHELRNPLQSLSVAVSVLSVLEKSPEVGKFLEQVERVTAQITAQMRDIADYSRLEAGVLTMRKTNFVLGELLQGTVDDFMSQAVDKKIVLILCNPDSETTLTSDHDRLRQILNNLMSNAVKFTDHGSVTVSAWVKHLSNGRAYLNLSVSDTGPGIAQDDLPQLFRVFSQLNSPKKKLGTGLGLAIVKRIVLLLEGDIDVQSKIDAGTCMTVRVPINVPERAN